MAKILSIIPYSFYPPMNGGSLRCFYLLQALAEEHEVYVLTTQPKSDFKENWCSTFPASVQIISLAETGKMKSLLHHFLPEKIADGIYTRWLQKSISVSRNEFLLKAYHVLNNLSAKIDFDIVLYENMESFACLHAFWERRMGKPLQILDAHNVDSHLWLEQARIEGSTFAKKYAVNALVTEKNLAKTTDFIFACSQQDFFVLDQYNKGQLNGAVVPNGVDVKNKPHDDSALKAYNKEILFCGSLSYAPNKEGILWFYKDVFPLLRQIQPLLTLTVIGQLSDERPFLEMKDDKAVNFAGSVPCVQPYYYRSSVAIVPIKSGSGTRLKVLEAMCFGNPIVSTSKGAEGIAYINGKHILIADDPHEFAQCILRLLSDSLLFDRIRTDARTMVQRTYDWNLIGKKMNQEIKQLLCKN